MKLNHTFLSNKLIWFTVFLVGLIYACSKDKIKFTEKENDKISMIQKIQDKFQERNAPGDSLHLIQKIGGNKTLIWKIDWNPNHIKTDSISGNTYMYVPMIPTLASTGKQIKSINFARYLLVNLKNDKIEYFLANSFKDDTKKSDSFNGVLILKSLETKKNHYYSYVNGKVQTNIANRAKLMTIASKSESMSAASCYNVYSCTFVWICSDGSNIIINGSIGLNGCTIVPSNPDPYCNSTNGWVNSDIRYIGEICDGGGGDPPPPPPPPVDPNDPINGGGDGGGQLSPPVKIITDSLYKKYPCANLVISGLLGIREYADLVAPFQSDFKPDLTWRSDNLKWDPNNGGESMLGNTIVDPSSIAGLSSVITLNSNMLANSSKLAIASVSIHETLHAYINFVVVSNHIMSEPNYKFNGSWLNELDLFYDQYPLPPNYRDHYEIMTDYFNKAVDVLALYDNNQHTKKEYVMMMLFGLSTYDTDRSTQDQIRNLMNVYGQISVQYSIDVTEMNNFWRSQLFNAPLITQLPKSGC